MGHSGSGLTNGLFPVGCTFYHIYGFLVMHRADGEQDVMTAVTLQGLLEIKDTHRPQEGPMLLGIELP